MYLLRDYESQIPRTPYRIHPERQPNEGRNNQGTKSWKLASLAVPLPAHLSIYEIGVGGELLFKGELENKIKGGEDSEEARSLGTRRNSV